MRRLAKRTAIALAGVLILIFLSAVGTVVFLGTAAGSRFILGKATAAAADAGWKLSAKEMTLDVFQRLYLKSVLLTRGEDSVSLDELDVTYRVGFFPPSMNVELAKIVGPHLRMHSVVKDEEAPVPDSAPGEGLDPIRRLLDSPPASLTVKRFSMNGLEFDYSSSGPKKSYVAAKGRIAAVEGSLAVSAGRFVFNGSAREALVDAWAFGNESLAGEGSSHFDGTADLSATKANGIWLQRLAVKDAKLTFDEMSGRYGEKKQPWSITSLVTTLAGTLVATGPEVLRIDRLAIDTLDTQSHTFVTKVSVGPTRQPLFATPSMELTSLGKRTDKLLLDTRGTVQRAVVTGIRGPIEAAVAITVEAPLDFKSIAMRGEWKADGHTIAQGALNLTAGDPTKIESSGTLLLKAPFTRRVSSLASVAGNDGVHGSFTLRGVAKTAMTHVLDAPRWAKAPIETKFHGELIPDGRRSTKLSAGRMTSDGTVTRSDGAWKLVATATTDRVIAGKADVRNPSLETTANYEADGSGTLAMAAVLEGQKFLEASVTLESPGRMKGQVKATVAPPLSRHLDTDVGRWTMKSSFASWHRDGAYEVEAAGDLVQDAATPSPVGTVQFAGPASWKMNGKMNVVDGSMHGVFEGELPAIDIADLGRWGALRAQATVDSKGKSGRQDAKLVATVKQEELRFKKSLAPGLPPLHGIQIETRASIVGGTRFTLEKLEASLGDKILAFTGSAAGRVDSGSYQMALKFSADVPKSFPAVKGQRLSGHAEIPLTINVGGGRDIDVDGDLILSNLQWSQKGMAMSGIAGRVPMHYQLVRDGKAIRFAYLTTQNPFERVDYERLRPLLARAEQVRVEEVRFADRRYGPLVGVFSMRQNLLFAHHFDASFGKHGSVGGEFFVDLNPQNLRVGLLSRVTAINLSEVLPTKSLVRVPSGTQTVSGRSGLVVDVRSGTVDGRFDITEIGAAQLIMLINACDPTFENEKFNLARTALSLGYPTFVGAKLERGYMDLAIDLKVVGVAQHYDVRGVPLSTFLASAFADARTNFAKEKVR